MLAVAKDYQNKGVGARLKWAQRERALTCAAGAQQQHSLPGPKGEVHVPQRRAVFAFVPDRQPGDLDARRHSALAGGRVA